MNKILIHYFSGTGNTSHAVTIIRESLIKNGYNVKLLSINKDITIPDEKYDFHIFAFPVLGFSAPVIVKRYISKLKDGNGVKAAVAATYGGHSMQALRQVKRMLQRRHFEVFLTGGAEYPDNWIQVSNLPDSNESRKIITKGDLKIESFIEKFINQKRDYFKCGFFNSLWTWLAAVLFGS